MRGNEVRRQFLTWRHQHRALNDVLKLADVARPWISPEVTVAIRRNRLHVFLVKSVEHRNKVVGEERNRARTIPERRQVDMENVEPVVEILADASLADRLLDAVVRGGRTRTSTSISFSPPTRRKRFSSRTRKRLTWAFSSIVLISSKNIVPPSACSNRRGRVSTAPL
jgi:hypothetical protein